MVPRGVADIDVAEVVLAELAGHALKARQRYGGERHAQPPFSSYKAFLPS